MTEEELYLLKGPLGPIRNLAINLTEAHRNPILPVMASSPSFNDAVPLTSISHGPRARPHPA